MDTLDQKLIVQTLSEFAPFPFYLQKEILQQAELIDVKRNQFLTKQGEIESSLYIVVEGVSRVFIESEKKEHNLLFSYPGTLAGSPDSLMSGAGSLFHVQALSQGKMWRIPGDFFRSELNHLDFVQWRRTMVEKILLGRLMREVELTTLNAEQRYHNFVKRSGFLLNQISHKHLASYLQMSPETFSRIHQSFSG